MNRANRRLSIMSQAKSDPWPFGLQNYFFDELADLGASFPFDITFHAKSGGSSYEFRAFRLIDRSWIEDASPISDLAYDRIVTSDRASHEAHQGFLDRCRTKGQRVFNSATLQCLLNDKLAFSEYCEARNFPCAACLPLDALEKVRLAPGERAFLKPRYGFGGTGIFLLSNIAGEFVLQACDRSGLQPRLRNIRSPGDILSSLPHLDYVVSPEVPTALLEGRPFDIRVIVQKKSVGTTPKCIGAVIRAGLVGSVVSNLSANGTALPIESMPFLLGFAAYSPATRRLLDQVMQLCQDLVQSMTGMGDIAEVGVDVLISKELRPFLIEANAKPARWAFSTIADNSEFDQEIRSSYRGKRSIMISNILSYAESALR